MDEAAAKTIYHRAWLAVKKQGETPNEAHTSTPRQMIRSRKKRSRNQGKNSLAHRNM